MSIRSDSIPFVLPLAIGTAILAAVGSSGGYVLGLITVAVAAFFRDPERISNAAIDAVLSPADGRVLAVDETDDGRARITIFLSVFNVHVARSPAAGELVRSQACGGGFAAAFSPKADKNARVEMEILTTEGLLEVTLFAGLVARRVLPWVAAPATLRRGQRIAIIRFGSRSRVILPKSLQATVKKGEQVRAGLTPLGRRKPERA
ncbi:MAG: phosphatidylserine decarboxylase family protein [Acidobacteria bacterium]|nr:phosphatidylserine decarboxylase family protein [Acidobacteriota bacterium]